MRAAVYCLAGVIFLVSAVNAGPIASTTAKPTWQSFFCQYFSDGTYTCYPEYSTRNGTDDTSRISPERVDEAFAIVGGGKAVKGTWQTSDGFFTLSNSTGPRTYAGTCMFDQTGFQCSGPSTFTTDADGNVSGMGGALYRGEAFTGIPGGPIKATLRQATSAGPELKHDC